MRDIIGKSLLLASAALSFAAYPQAALAQTSGESASASGEIVVTARRRAEALQDVPLAVSAFSADQLEATGAVDITTITRATPNVTFEVSRGTNTTLTAFIRGIGQQDPLWGFEPGVGLYVDDVYIARPQGSILDIFDIERLEVLRGPQGTLYGRNTIGGAIKYVTRRIGGEPEARAKVNIGSYDQRDVILSGSSPLGAGFAIGGALAIFERDGYGRNLVTGAEHYNKDVTSGRLTLEWTPNDALFFRLAGDRTEDDSNAKHGHRLLPSRDGVFQVLDDEYDTRGTAGDRNRVETQGASLQGEWTVNDNLTLKSITAYREGETRTPIDFDALPRPDLDVPAVYADEQFSQELQALFEYGDVSGVAGLYYLNGVASGAFETILGTSTNIFFPNGTTPYTAGKVNTLSTSAFADLTWDVTDKWAVSAGGRYTSDEKTATVLRLNFNGVGTPIITGNRGATQVGAAATNFRRSRTDEKFSPRASISYKPNEDLAFYASYSQGFKSGGFDPRANFAATPAAAQPLVLRGFEPEIVDSYELGAKGSFFQDRLQLNTALFFADYSDQQVTVQEGVDTNGDGVNDNIVSSIFNAGSSEYSGLEIEGSLKVTETFRANFAIGYIDAEVKEVISNGVNVQRDANRLNDFVPQNTPEITAQFGGLYTIDLAEKGAIDVSGSVSHRGEYYIFNTVVNQGFGPGASAAFPRGGPKLDADAVTLLDLSAVWTSESGRLTLGLHGKNLTDERYRVALYNFAYPSTTGIDSAYSAFYGPPRTVTGTLTVNF